MNKAILTIISAGLSAVITCSCAALPGGETVAITEPYTVNTSIEEVTSDPAFGEYGRLIFPVDSGYYSGDALGDLGLVWYNHIDPDKTVEICNYMKEQATAGNQIFYDIYTADEKAADPAKEDTGLFFFKGEPGAKFAICNAGGGFAYVGAMHDSFPHALELSKKGYNAFALIYRPGAQTACEDLARAIAFIHEQADELEVDTDRYSLWGGSAGARMAAYLGSYGTAAFGEDDYPQPGAVIMQYTGHSEVLGTEPPTYACVGTNDWIASYSTMERRTERIKRNGTDAEIEVFEGLPHGFGLGTGTVAEGWLDRAVEFWEGQENSLAKRVQIVYTLKYKLQRKQAASCITPSWTPLSQPLMLVVSARRRKRCSSRPQRSSSRSTCWNRPWT